MNNISPLAAWSKCKPVPLFCRMNMSYCRCRGQQETVYGRLRLAAQMNWGIIRRAVSVTETWRGYLFKRKHFYVNAHCSGGTAITCKRLSNLHLCHTTIRECDALWCAGDRRLAVLWYGGLVSCVPLWNANRGQEAEKGHSVNMWTKKPKPCCRPARAVAPGWCAKPIKLAPPEHSAALYQPVITHWEHTAQL